MIIPKAAIIKTRHVNLAIMLLCPWNLLLTTRLALIRQNFFFNIKILLKLEFVNEAQYTQSTQALMSYYVSTLPIRRRVFVGLRSLNCVGH